MRAKKEDEKMATTKTDISVNDEGIVTYSWTNTVKVTSDNILDVPHVVEIECVDDLTEEQRRHFVYATLKRQVQSVWRNELKDSKDADFLHDKYPEGIVQKLNASDYAFSGKRESDPAKAIKKDVQKLKGKGMTKAQILALLADELDD